MSKSFGIVFRHSCRRIPVSVCRRTDPMPMAVGFEPRPLDLHVGSAPEALKRKPLESSITMMYLAGKGSRKKVFEQTLH